MRICISKKFAGEADAASHWETNWELRFNSNESACAKETSKYDNKSTGNIKKENITFQHIKYS